MCRPIQSVIILVINKSDSRCAVVRFCYHSIVWLQTEFDSTQSYYHYKFRRKLQSPGIPIWRPENSVNIWNLLWISRPLIISTDQTSIYITTFPNALTSSKKTHIHEISVYFSTNSILALCHLHKTWNPKCSGFRTKHTIEL